MCNLMVFEGHEVEAFEFKGKVLFNPYHVGECLELNRDAVRKAMSRMNEKQVFKVTNSDVTNNHIRKLNNAGENFLTESGVYTGTFADMLNWAGTSEDVFNEKLAACGSESERVNLVMQEMANQGLIDAGKRWQENNKNLVDGNKATADFQQATAELADTVAPLITKITELVAGLIEEFNQLSPEGQRLIAGCVLVVAAIAPILSGIGSIAMGIQTLIPLISSLWTVLGPMGIVVIIGLIVLLYNKCEWFRNGVIIKHLIMVIIQILCSLINRL